METLKKRGKLVLLRGLPGAGKTTFASAVAALVQDSPSTLIVNTFAADDYFMRTGEYLFDASKLPDAHAWCREEVRMAMAYEVDMILVHNTFTTNHEMQPYFELADTYDYDVVSLIVENRHGNKSVHGVPEETMKKMKDRFSVCL